MPILFGQNVRVSFIPFNLYLYKYENVCLSVCLFVTAFLGHFETDWDTLWHIVSFYPREGSKTIVFKKTRRSR